MPLALVVLAQAIDELPAGTGGFGAQLARTSLALLIVCVAAWWLVRFAARRGMLGATAKGQHITVIERVALDPRRSLHLVRVGKRVLVLGASEEGLRTLAELSADELQPSDERSTSDDSDDAPPSDEPSKPKRTFADALAARAQEKKS